MDHLSWLKAGLLALMASVALDAATYWVSPTGTATWANCRSAAPLNGTAAGILGSANSNAMAGDTVYLRAGRYSDATVNPVNSGSSDATRITYRNYESEVVTIADAVTYDVGLRLDTKSYITVQGINFTGQKRFLYIRYRSNYNIIAYCNFDSALLTGGATATWAGSVIAGSSQHNRIHHCRFSNYGYYNSDDIGCVLDVGSESDSLDTTRYNLIEDCHFFHGGHHVMGVYGKYNVIRNNRFHNEPWSMGTTASDRGAVLYGDRNLSFSGYSRNGGRNLFEGNRVGYSADPSDNNGASGMSMNSSENIVRFNAYFNNISAGLSMSVTGSYLQSIVRNRVYHNTFFNNGHNPYDPTDHMSSGVGFGIYSGALVITGNALKNNILYGHRIPFGEYNINTADRKGLIALQTFENNWDGDTKGDPRFISASLIPGDPMDSVVPDVHLQANSPCIDAGVALTTMTSPGNSGTSLQVADAGYFMDGWGISGVAGDEIQLFGTAQKAIIVSVNYQTNTLTLDRSLTWTQNQGVGLSYKGSAPDIGAYEHDTAGTSIKVVAPVLRPGAFTMVTVYNLRGQVVRRQKGMTDLERGLRSGAYVLRIAGNGVQTSRKRLISGTIGIRR